TNVPVIDFSCADEVIAKLLLRYGADDPPQEAYFVFRGVSDDHWAAIEQVLERHELALVMDRGDTFQVVGVVTEYERQVWNALGRLGHADVEEAAKELDADASDVARALDGLRRRRLVVHVNGRYVAIGGSNRGQRQ